VSENRTTDAPRDPAFAAVARVLDAEKAFTAAVAVKDYSRDVGLDEARAALAGNGRDHAGGLSRDHRLYPRGDPSDRGRLLPGWGGRDVR